MQSDNVLELDVITGKGEKITCSPLSNADLFHTVRAGLGQVGIITRATLKLIPAPEKARRYVLIYATRPSSVVPRPALEGVELAYETIDNADIRTMPASVL